ncbi:MAG: hypothetical protein FWE91_08240 [Defluviitaleaceae bacterium]|nr:hypothetical protein [Defluviitaleaceae bacterium]MCL2835324.1 hypothetical protein [Defluviitaleaceae bacterium]
MFKKLFAMLLAGALTLAVFSACDGAASQNQTQAPPETPGDVISLVQEFSAMLATAEDVSDMPDWAGPQLTLRYWDGHGTGRATRPTSSHDVVWPEVSRVTGITIDIGNSIDNTGLDLPSRTAILAATNDWPHLGYNVQSEDLVNAGILWDLTDLIPIYAPNTYRVMNALHPPREGDLGGWQNTGRWFEFPVDYRPRVNSVPVLHPDVDMNRFMYVEAPPPRLGWNTEIMVRDDILKLAFPDARTQDELEALFMEKGYFDREDLYDIPGTSKEDVFDFFYKIAEVIKEHNITENGLPVYATYLGSGGDNWALLASFLTGINGLPNVNYFTYWNTQTQSLQRLFTDDWFKEDMLRFNMFLRDGVAPRASLIDDGDTFTNKLNNGQYAITYAWNIPNQTVLEAAGKPYRYRRVFFDIEQDTSFALNPKEAVQPVGGISIFKDAVSEDQLPQLLMWLDFMHSDAGMKLNMWGPRSAGLFEDTPDGRRFTQDDLVQMAVFGVQNGIDVRYNLQGADHVGSAQGGAWPHIPFGGLTLGGIYYPKYVYDMTQFPRDPGMVNLFFHAGLFDLQTYSQYPIRKSPDIWSFFDEVPSLRQFWDVRDAGFEPAMTRILTASTDEEFETLFQRMVDFAEQNGLTEEALREAEQLMRDVYPTDWAAWLAGY